MNKILLFFIAFCTLLLLSACTGTNVNTVTSHQYYQDDYNYFCFDENKTFSQIIVCLTAEGKAERTQNAITNDLLSENQEKKD